MKIMIISGIIGASIFLAGCSKKEGSSRSAYTHKPGSENEWQLRGTAEDYAVGYSQLFCRTASSFPGGYCEDFTSAGFSDIEFMFHWPKELRRKLTPTPCYHIGERKVAWYGFRQNPGLSSPGTESSTPTFRLQEYPKTGLLLVHRLDRNKQICQVSIETDAGFLKVGTFRPEDYHAIPWAYQVPQATLHIYESGGEIIRQQPIIRR